ncbi:MAG: PEGA domain-containing protein [Defluviitaleaceae bacterium]|nr:PEGA domain-containing protein [Defluviitaleaceae bacterium]
MPNNKFNDFDDFDDFDDYEGDSFDNFKYDDDESYETKFDNYDENFTLTSGDDESPLTSSGDFESSSAMQYDDEDSFDTYSDEKESRSSRTNSRRETITRIAADQQSGIKRKPGVTAPDPRIASIKGDYSNAKNTKKSPGSAYSFSGMPDSLRPRPSGANRQRQKSKFAIFSIVGLILGIGACLAVLLLVMPNAVGEGVFAFDVIPSPTPTPHSSIVTAGRNANLRPQTSLITAISDNGVNRTLTLLDISNRSTQEFVLSDEALLTDRWGNPMNFAGLRAGNIVDIGYDPRSIEIVTLSTNRQSRELNSRTNVQVDVENWEVTLGGDVWNFNSQTLVLNRGENFSAGLIRPIDSITLVTHGDTVWLMQVEAAHGFLQVANTDTVTNGSIMIGNARLYRLSQVNEDIVLPEGTHRIIVEGDNIEPFIIEDLVITQGEITRINLGDAEPRAAFLHIQVNPADAQVFVNGQLHEEAGPVEVVFGEQFVRVERHGFIPQEQRFEISNNVHVISFDLVEIIHENTLVIFTSPTNAEIFINNVFIGHSTLTHRVSAGTLDIVARLQGYTDSRLTITVTGDETEDIMRSLLLMPAINDPIANMPPHMVDPIPSPTPTPPPDEEPAPLPTIPPSPPIEIPTPPPPEPDPIPEPPDEVLPDLPNDPPWANPPPW